MNQISQADLDRLQLILNKGGRTAFYTELAGMYAGSGTPFSQAAYFQLQVQAQISSYSGAWGGFAIAGNLWAKLQNPEAYSISVDGREARLSPGMSATVEVVTGRRRVIEYLLSPIAKATGEAGRER